MRSRGSVLAMFPRASYVRDLRIWQPRSRLLRALTRAARRSTTLLRQRHARDAFGFAKHFARTRCEQEKGAVAIQQRNPRPAEFTRSKSSPACPQIDAEGYAASVTLTVTINPKKPFRSRGFACGRPVEARNTPQFADSCSTRRSGAECADDRSDKRAQRDRRLSALNRVARCPSGRCAELTSRMAGRVPRLRRGHVSYLARRRTQPRSDPSR